MNKKMYTNQSTLLAGMTLKDAQRMENNKLAFHVCETEAAAIQNRQALADALSMQLAPSVCANQTHSARSQEVRKQDRRRGVYKIETQVSTTGCRNTYGPQILLFT